MAVPTVLSISPNSGPTGGKKLVTITGTNFRLPDPPPATGKTTKPGPTVSVTFGGREASRVLVLSATQLLVLTPIGDAKAKNETSGVRAVVVTNLDNDGDPIAGETVTVTNGFTFKRPDLSAESYLTRVVRTFLQEWKRQVMENVVLTTHVDFDASVEDKLNTIAVADLPAIVMVGPQMPENRFYSLNVRRYREAVGGFEALAVPLTVDLVFDVILLADTEQELLNLGHQAMRFVDRNDFLSVPVNPADPLGETLDHEFDFADNGSFSARNLLGLSNVRQMAGRVEVRGVDLDDVDPVVDRTVETVDVSVGAGVLPSNAAVDFNPGEPEQLAKRKPLGPSPGEDRT